MFVPILTIKLPSEFCWSKSRLFKKRMPSIEDNKENFFGGNEKNHAANGFMQLLSLHEFLYWFSEILPLLLIIIFLPVLFALDANPRLLHAYNTNICPELKK